MQRKFFNGVICGAFIALALLALRLHQIERDQAAALAKLQRKTEALEKQLATNPNAVVLDTEAQILRSLQLASNAVDRVGPSWQEQHLRPIPQPWEAVPNVNVAPYGAQLPEPTMPPGSIPFKFNGETHYWVPLANASPDSVIVAR